MRRWTKVTSWGLLWVANTLGCEGCRERQQRADDFARGLTATDCPADVAVCVGGEVFQSVGQRVAPGEPCRQNTLGACDRACLAEGVTVVYPAGVDAREQLCAPAAKLRSQGEPAGPLGAQAVVRCQRGEIVVQDGRDGRAPVRWSCAHGCATDDPIEDEELDGPTLTALLCRRGP